MASSKVNSTARYREIVGEFIKQLDSLTESAHEISRWSKSRLWRTLVYRDCRKISWGARPLTKEMLDLANVYERKLKESIPDYEKILKGVLELQNQAKPLRSEVGQNFREHLSKEHCHAFYKFAEILDAGIPNKEAMAADSGKVADGNILGRLAELKTEWNALQPCFNQLEDFAKPPDGSDQSDPPKSEDPSPPRKLADLPSLDVNNRKWIEATSDEMKKMGWGSTDSLKTKRSGGEKNKAKGATAGIDKGGFGWRKKQDVVWYFVDWLKDNDRSKTTKR